MQQFEYTVTDPAGLHARPAGNLVRKVKGFSSRVTLTANGKTCVATQLIALMGMKISRGTVVNVSVEGEDEGTCARELQEWFAENL